MPDAAYRAAFQELQYIIDADVSLAKRLAARE